MVKITFNISRYRIKLTLAQKRRGSRDQFLKILDELIRVRVGSRISRLARQIVTLKRVQRFLGGFLAVLVLATNLFPPGSAVFSAQEETVVLPAAEQPVLTRVAKRLPVNGKLVITQGYWRFHSGVDIDGVTGDPIYPIMAGRVEEVRKDFFLGKMIVVSHQEGYKSVYGHLSATNVVPGQEVTTSSKIGDMGSTGRSTGDHLHLEVEKDGRKINPRTVLPVR